MIYEKKPAVTERPLDELVGRAEALLDLIESDFGQSGRSVRIEAIVCELRAMKQAVLWEMVAEKANSLAEIQKTLVAPNDRVEGRDAASSRRVPSHDGLCPDGGEK